MSLFFPCCATTWISFAFFFFLKGRMAMRFFPSALPSRRESDCFFFPRHQGRLGSSLFQESCRTWPIFSFGHNAIRRLSSLFLRHLEFDANRTGSPLFPVVCKGNALFLLASGERGEKLFFFRWRRRPRTFSR